LSFKSKIDVFPHLYLTIYHKLELQFLIGSSNDCIHICFHIPVNTEQNGAQL